MKTFSLSVILVVLTWMGASPAQAQKTNQNNLPPDAIHTGGPAAAQAAVDVWLGLVDDGQYEKAWHSTAELFRKTVSLEQWTNLATSHRTPLGKMLSRKLTSATFSKTLPGAPDGQYVVVEYECSFEHKKTARETGTAMLDVDGLWRVSGYFVR